MRFAGLSACLCVASVCVAVPGAFAGPTLLSPAQPGFNDPLAGARPAIVSPEQPAAADRDGTPEPVAGQSDPAFTIIGERNAEGLQAPETDEFARTVRQDFFGQRRARAQRPGTAGTAQLEASDEGNGSASDLIRALVNSAPGTAGGSQAGDSGGGGAIQAGGTQSAFASVLDDTMADLITTILNPKFDTEGMVTFSIAGFGEFALLLLQENQGLFIVDLQGGTAIKVSQTAQQALTGRQTRRQQALAAKPGSSTALQRLLGLFERNIVPIVTSPITLATILLFSIIWVVWRLSARG